MTEQGDGNDKVETGANSRQREQSVNGSRSFTSMDEGDSGSPGEPGELAEGGTLTDDASYLSDLVQMKGDEFRSSLREFHEFLKTAQDERMKLLEAQKKMTEDNQRLKEIQNKVGTLFRRLLQRNGKGDKISLSLPVMLAVIEKMFTENKVKVNALEVKNSAQVHTISGLQSENNRLQNELLSLQEKEAETMSESRKDLLAQLGTWFVEVLEDDNRQVLNSETFTLVKHKFNEYKAKAKQMDEIAKELFPHPKDDMTETSAEAMDQIVKASAKGIGMETGLEDDEHLDKGEEIGGNVETEEQASTNDFQCDGVILDQEELSGLSDGGVEEVTDQNSGGVNEIRGQNKRLEKEVDDEQVTVARNGYGGDPDEEMKNPSSRKREKDTSCLDNKKKKSRMVNKPTSFTCQICHRILASKTTLRSHYSYVHSGLKPYACQVCGKKFVNKAKLKRHAVVHSKERNFSCHMCGMTFALKEYLASHLKVHSDQRPRP